MNTLVIYQKSTLLCKPITVQKTDVLYSPSTSTRGAAHISCDSPSQPHGPAGCIWGRQRDPLRSSVPSPTTSAPSAHPHHQRPTPQHPTARCCAFSLGLRSLPARWAVPPLVQKIIGRIATSQAHFSTTRAEQSINHSRRPFRLPPSFSHQVVKPSSARPSACTTTCTAYDHDEDDRPTTGPILDLATIDRPLPLPLAHTYTHQHSFDSQRAPRPPRPPTSIPPTRATPPDRPTDTALDGDWVMI